MHLKLDFGIFAVNHLTQINGSFQVRNPLTDLLQQRLHKNDQNRSGGRSQKAEQQETPKFGQFLPAFGDFRRVSLGKTWRFGSIFVYNFLYFCRHFKQLGYVDWVGVMG